MVGDTVTPTLQAPGFQAHTRSHHSPAAKPSGATLLPCCTAGPPPAPPAAETSAFNAIPSCSFVPLRCAVTPLRSPPSRDSGL